MKSKLFAVCGCLLLLTGCAHIAVAQAQKEMTVTFNGLMGHTEEEVVMKLGAPINILNIGTLKVYQYHKSYGMRSNAYCNAYTDAHAITNVNAYTNSANAYTNTTSTGTGFGRTNVWESYDEAEVCFKDGCAISWKGYVQR